jgi:hypothetical protein
LLSEPLAPSGLPQEGLEVEEQHVEVVEAAKMLLQAAQRVRERPVPLGVDRGGQVRQLPHPSDADPKPVQTVHRRAFAGPSVSPGHVLPFPGLVLVEDTTEARPPDRAGSGSSHLTDMVEEVRGPFRTEKGAQELAAGAGIVPQAGSVAIELVELSTGIRAILDPLEEGERNIPVANLSDEPGQATGATIERPQRDAVGGGQELLPDGESGPESTHLAM